MFCFCFCFCFFKQADCDFSHKAMREKEEKKTCFMGLSFQVGLVGWDFFFFFFYVCVCVCVWGCVCVFLFCFVFDPKNTNILKKADVFCRKIVWENILAYFSKLFSKNFQVLV